MNPAPRKEATMHYVGVDLHRKSLTLCVLSQQREVVHRATIPCADTEKIVNTLDDFNDFEVAVEASATYEWFAKLVVPKASRFVLVHPYKMRIIAQSVHKSDKFDAHCLAKYLAMDHLPQAHIPLPRQRDLQVLVRHRRKVQKNITATRNRIRHLLARHNFHVKKPFTVEGRKSLLSLLLSEADQFQRGHLLADFDFGREQLREVDAELKRFAQAAPQIETEARRLIQTIPGIGPVTTNTFLAEVGHDVSRFSSCKKLVSYVGLNPGYRQSSDTRHELSISKQGSRFLRAAMIEAAWAAVRWSIRWRGVYRRLEDKTGKKKAIVAVARRLVTVIHAVLREGRPYSPTHLATTN
jgi:transposase